MAETASISHPVVYLLLLSTSLFFTGVMSGHTLENVCSEEERNSLLQFKTKLFDPNGILSSWTEEDNCCRWKGISCDESGGVVTVDLHNPNATDPYDLDFYSFGLSGEIDSSLLSLQNLRHLDLSGNNFSASSFPSFIGSLKELRYLNLSFTQLVGVIPSQFGNLTSLQFLDLSYNFGLTLEASRGLSFIAHLSSLQYIDMSEIISVNVTDLFQELNSLPSISVIRLNRFPSPPTSQSIPPSLFPQLNFKNLTVLSLPGNMIFSEFNVPDWLFKIETLEYLDLSFFNPDTSSSRQSNIIPVSIGNLYRLKFLDLSGNSVSGSIPDSIGNLSLLQEIHLERNNLVGSIPNSIGNLSLLQEIHLESNNLVGSIPDSIGNLLSLRILDLSYNQLNGSIPESVGRFQSLQQLDLSFNLFLGGPIPTSISNLSSLEELKLDYNKFEGSNWLSNVWKMMPNMRILSLAANNFSGTIPSSLCNLKWDLFDLSINNFSGRIPDCLVEVRGYLNLASNNLIGSFPTPNGTQCSLWYLNMEGNSLTGILPVWLTNCEGLTILKLGKNKLTGNITTWVAEIMPSSLRILDLSRNNLYGRLPPSFKNFKALQKKSTTLATYTISVLMDILMDGKIEKVPQTISVRTSIDFSGNYQLSGEIPEDIGSLLGLQSLNLSGNHLTGNIPETISRLKALEILDLSINNLSGGIPQSMSSMTTLSHLNLSFNNLSGEIPTGNQFSTFTDPSVFMGNPYLCGFSYRSCDNRQIPISREEHKDKVEMLWVYLNMVLGFVVGFWLFYGTLIFKKTWRTSYFHVLQDFNEKVILRCKILWKTVSNKTNRTLIH